MKAKADRLNSQAYHENIMEEHDTKAFCRRTAAVVPQAQELMEN